MALTKRQKDVLGFTGGDASGHGSVDRRLHQSFVRRDARHRADGDAVAVTDLYVGEYRRHDISLAGRRRNVKESVSAKGGYDSSRSPPSWHNRQRVAKRRRYPQRNFGLVFLVVSIYERECWQRNLNELIRVVAANIEREGVLTLLPQWLGNARDQAVFFCHVSTTP